MLQYFFSPPFLNIFNFFECFMMLILNFLELYKLLREIINYVLSLVFFIYEFYSDKISNNKKYKS